MLILACMVSFGSCSSDDDDDNGSVSNHDERLVGTWGLTNGADSMTFNSNGTISEKEKEGEGLYQIWYQYEGTWTTSGNSKVTIHWNSGQYFALAYMAWRNIPDAEETVTINYSVSSNGKTLTWGDVEGEAHSEPVYYYKQ